jgi:NAD(P)-dependent dehydrogenase (short-subunit alcohol dehydrogenase family)
VTGEEADMAGRVAFVTGGARGFGLTFGREIASGGGSVAVVDVDIDEAKAAADELSGLGGRAVAVRCDVSDDADVDRAVAQAVDAFGGIDILLNNAGKHLSKYNQPFGALSRRDVRELFDVNVIGVVNCTLSCRDAMRGRPGASIVNLASISGHMSNTPYGVSKLAVRGLTVAFAQELAPDGIRVNAISPGLMGTAMALADLPEAAVQELVNNRQLIHRIATPEDVVGVALFLCSDAARFVTGETVMVSGGYPLGV